MASNCIYWGLFFDDGAFAPGSLDNDIANKHVTFAFRGSCPMELVGSRWTVEVTGYANDEVNEGVSVCLPDDLYYVYDNPSEPHVTLSVADGGKPKDTGNLSFDDAWNGPVFAEGTIGYFGFDEQYHF